MSFLSRVSPSAIRVARSPFTLQNATLSTSVVRRSVLDPVKDAAKKVDRTVADQLVKGIETGEKVAQATKETVGINSAKAEGAAAETSGELKGKASELAGEAKGKASELAGEAKGKKEEMKSKI